MSVEAETLSPRDQRANKLRDNELRSKYYSEQDTIARWNFLRNRFSLAGIGLAGVGHVLNIPALMEIGVPLAVAGFFIPEWIKGPRVLMRDAYRREISRRHLKV